MDTETKPAEEATKNGTNGKADQSRISQLFGKTTSATKNTCKDVFLISKELALSPLRGSVALGMGAVLDANRWWETKVPSTLVGVPLGIAVVMTGLTPVVATGALIARFAQSAQTTMGSLIAGAVGFLIGTTLVVWAWELAVAVALIETLLFVSRAAESALSEEQARDLALAQSLA